MTCYRCTEASVAGKRFCPACGESLSGSSGTATPRPGDRIGEFEVDELVSGGGFATIFAVRHVEDGAPYVVKHYRYEQLRLPGVEPRMLRARGIYREIADLPGIVRVIRDGEDPRFGRFQLMERVHGPDIRGYLACLAAPPPVEVTHAIGIGLLNVLSELERRRIVHRDIKCSNILLRQDRSPTDPGGVVLCDMDFLRKSGDDDRTRFEVRSGQFFDPEAGSDSDQYAAGVVLLHLLAGTVDLTGEQVRELRGRLDLIDPVLGPLVRRAIGPVDERHPTIAHFAAAWQRATKSPRDSFTGTYDRSLHESPRTSVRKLAAGLIAILVGATAFFTPWSDEDMIGTAGQEAAHAPIAPELVERQRQIDELLTNAEADAASSMFDQATDAVERAIDIAAAEPADTERTDRARALLRRVQLGQVDWVLRESDDFLNRLYFAEADAGYRRALNLLSRVDPPEIRLVGSIERRLADEVLIRGCNGQIRVGGAWVTMTVDNLVRAAVEDERRRRALYERALREAPTHQQANLGLAKCLLESRRDTDVATIARCLEIAYGGPDIGMANEAAFEAARLAYRLENRGALRRALTHLLDHDPDPFWRFLEARFAPSATESVLCVAKAIAADPKLKKLSSDRFPLLPRDRSILHALVNEHLGLLNLAQLQLQDALISSRDANARSVLSGGELENFLTHLARIAAERERLMRTLAYERDGVIYTLGPPPGSSLEAEAVETKVTSGHYPLWSPDKTRLVFFRQSKQGPALWIVRIADGTCHEICTNLNAEHHYTLETYAAGLHQEGRTVRNGVDEQPEAIGWHDDGRTLVYPQSARPALDDEEGVLKFEKGCYDALGETAQTHDPDDLDRDDQSVRIELTRQDAEAGGKEWRYSVDGRVWIRCRHSGYVPSWKLDKRGARIVYRREGELRVWDIVRKLEHKVPTADEASFGNYPSWSPDARHVLVSDGDRMTLIHADGAEPPSLLEPRGTNPQWTPYSYLSIVVERQKHELLDSMDELLRRALEENTAPTHGHGKTLAWLSELASYREPADASVRLEKSSVLAKGFDALRRREGDTALAHFEEAAALDPACPEARIGMALALLEPWSSETTIRQSTAERVEAAIDAATQCCPKADYFLLDTWLQAALARSGTQVADDRLNRAMRSLTAARTFRGTLGTRCEAIIQAAERAMQLSEAARSDTTAPESIPFDRRVFRVGVEPLSWSNPLSTEQLAQDPAGLASIAVHAALRVRQVEHALRALPHSRASERQGLVQQLLDLLQSAWALADVDGLSHLDNEEQLTLIEQEAERVCSIDRASAPALVVVVTQRLEEHAASHRAGHPCADCARLLFVRAGVRNAVGEPVPALRDYLSADRITRALGERDPEIVRPDEYLELASLAVEQGAELDRARAMLMKLVAAYPDDPRPLGVLAELVEFVDGDSESALVLAQRAIAIGGHEPGPLLSAAEYALVAGNAELSVELAEQAAQVAEANQDVRRRARLQQAMALRTLGRYSDAIKVCDRIADDDRHGDPRIIGLHIAAGQYGVASSIAKELILRGGLPSASARCDLAALTLMRDPGTSPNTVSLLRDAFGWRLPDELAPRSFVVTTTDNVLIHLVVGNTLLQGRGDLLGALSCFDKAIALEPTNCLALARAAECEARLSLRERSIDARKRRMARALALLERLREADRSVLDDALLRKGLRAVRRDAQFEASRTK
ncbi:MAG: hypothetical protein KDC95_15695 [Planctomycetes bacterium]|nr:hypothetical protein [Planctomycetota bacterium]